MILGMSTHLYTHIHVAISLIAIATGLIVVLGMLANNALPGTTALFLITTALTSVTGFFFPWKGFTPGIKLGIISLVVLCITLIARNRRWRRTYIITAIIALYLNVFVLVAQSFQKVPALKALAPTQREPPFLIAQLVVMALFVVLTIFAAKRFREEPASPRARAA